MDDGEGTDPRELMAHKYNLNYIPLDGNIACLVNGAGLAMATMDAIKMYNGTPANFLDVGGRVDEESVLRAFEIIVGENKQVKSILVNIFGGIVNCETIARGVQNAFKKTKLTVPLIVRLEGTAAESARKMLANSGLPIITATDLDDAAKKAVESIK
jgi:succinyl-CoA synthetase beta subunit